MEYRIEKQNLEEDRTEGLTGEITFWELMRGMEVIWGRLEKEIGLGVTGCWVEELLPGKAMGSIALPSLIGSDSVPLQDLSGSWTTVTTGQGYQVKSQPQAKGRCTKHLTWYLHLFPSILEALMSFFKFSF